MAFPLSFTPEFFLAEGEPYDRSDRALNERGQPVSVWSAICEADDQTWARWADHFDCHPEHLQPETVFDAIQAINTCSNLDSPVAVWIDECGALTVEVYDDV